MENQHRMIQGYRELTEAEIARMNAIKNIAAGVGELCLQMREEINKMPEGSVVECGEKREALRWLNEGEMQAQQAFMSLTRAVARPTSF